jgi:hypothetical protein
MLNTLSRQNRSAAITNRLPSPAIWSNCPLDDIRNGVESGIIIDEDFIDFPFIGTQTTEIAHGRFKVFNTGSGVVKQVESVNSVVCPGGILEITLDTDNDSGSIAQSYPAFLMSGLTTNSGKLWFEARICYSPVTTNGIGWFVGLAETDAWTLATGVPFNGGDAITNSASAIGFRKPEDDTTTADTVYSDRATSFTAIGDADLTSMAAYTWAKIGFTYDPEKTTTCVQFFKDNVLLTNQLSKSTLTGLTNLDANSLGILIAMIADSSGTSGKLYVDWVRCAQLLPTVSVAS